MRRASNGRNPFRDNIFLNAIRILVLSIQAIVRRRFSFRDFILQLYEFSIASLGIILFCVCFVGIIITLEYSFHMKLVIGDDSLIPSFAMVMMTRELAPIVTALLITSKMGASIAAELGSMKNTEQLDAYRLLGMQPVEFYVAPRFVACAIATMLLSIVALSIAIVGALLSATTFLDFTTDTFLRTLFVFVGPSDFLSCLVKALLFGASIPIISSTYGFRCRFGAEGVGEATTNAVVGNSIWIIFVDFLVTYLFSNLG